MYTDKMTNFSVTDVQWKMETEEHKVINGLHVK